MDEDNSRRTEGHPEGPSPDAPDAGDTHANLAPADGLQGENEAAEQQQTAAAQHQGQQQQPHTTAGTANAAAPAEAASAEPAKHPTDGEAATSSSAAASAATAASETAELGDAGAAAAKTPAAKQHDGDTLIGSDAAAGEPLTSAADAESGADAAAPRSPVRTKHAAAAAAGNIVTAEQKASADAEADSEQAASDSAEAGQAVAGSTSPEQHASGDQQSASADPAAMEAPAKPLAPSSASAEHPTDAAVQPNAESSSPPAAAAKPAAAKLAVAKKPAAAKKKPAQVSVTGGSGGGTGAAAGSPGAVQSTHGSNPAKKGLHTLFGEASTLSVLSQEGSEMPGSRPPAQLHAALDGHDHRPIGETLMDDEEQQEIQKIISEIHGNGDDSDGDESQDDRLADIKHQHLAPHAAAAAAPQHVPGSQGSTAAGGANSSVPSSLMMPQQQTADDILVYEQSGLSPGAAAASVGPATESSTAMSADDVHSPQQQRGRGSPSPWPGVTQIQHELLDPDTSVEPTPAAHTAAPKTLGQHTGSPGHQSPAAEPSGYNPGGYDSDAYAESAAAEDEGLTQDPEGLANEQAEGLSQGVIQGLGEGGGTYGNFEGGGGNEEERSRAIAEQLAQLHEESRRLHLQSQLLQHQAIEMSLQMATSANLSSSSPAADPHTHHISNIGAHPNTNQQEQQAMSYNPAAGSSHSSAETLGLGFSQAVTPGGVPLNPETLGLVEGAGQRPPPGDGTPSSVTSSRAGLNWNIPSRGGIPSPGKAGGMSPAMPGSPNVRGVDARSNFNTIAHGFALHADPSLDYQMYTYHNDNSSNSAAAADGYQPPPPQQQRQQQQPMQELYGHYQQQQQRQEPAHEQYLHQQQQHQVISTQQQQQQQQHHDAGHARSMGHKAAETAAHDPPSPTAATSGHGGRAFRTQRSLRGSKPGHKEQQKPVEPPLVVRKPTLPVKQGSGASTRVAAAGATAGRRASSDNITSYYSLVDETPVVGTFNAAHAVVGAQGTVVKAKQQQQGKLSPRASLTSATLAAPAAAAAGGGKVAAGTAATSAAAAAAAAAATSKLAHKPVATAGRSRSGDVSPEHGSSAAALAAAAAAATSSSSGGYPQQNRPRMHPHPAPPPPPAAAAGPWGAVPVNPYAAAAMYGGGYAAVNPGLVPMMMQNPMQAPGNTNGNKKGLGGKISPGRGAGGNNMSHPESLTSMTAAMPPGMWMPVGLPPGFMPVMPPGHMSNSGSKGGVVPPGSNPNKTAAGRGIGGSNSAPAGVQYGLPGMAPGQFMPMPGMPPMAPGQMGYPRMGFAPNPYAMNPQQAAMAAATAGGGRGGAAGKFPALGHNTAQQGGGGRAGRGSVPAGIPAGYMPAAPGAYGMPAAAAAGYPAAGGPWGPMMGPPGQFGMMPMYAAAPGVMAGYQQQQQQGGKGVKGASGNKGGWQS